MAKKAPVGKATMPTQISQAVAGSSIAYSANHLANQFLIAMPGMVDPNFAGSVIYLFEHTERGAMGLVINRPTELDMGAYLKKLRSSWKLSQYLINRSILVVQCKSSVVLSCTNPPQSWLTALPWLFQVA